MKKIITIIYLFFFILITSYGNSKTNPPFKNILVNENPINYEDIFFEDFNGKIVNLKNEQSRIFILNFWATWCLPCKEEMPYLDELQKINGIKIFPINVEENNKAKAEIFFKNLEIKNLSIYFDLNNKLLNLFYVRGLPTSIILNKDRKEIARILGAVDFSDQKFIDWINSVSN